MNAYEAKYHENFIVAELLVSKSAKNRLAPVIPKSGNERHLN